MALKLHLRLFLLMMLMIVTAGFTLPQFSQVHELAPQTDSDEFLKIEPLIPESELEVITWNDFLSFPLMLEKAPILISQGHISESSITDELLRSQNISLPPPGPASV